MSLFRKSDDKVRQEDEGQAELARLQALSVEGLAIELLPAFTPERPGSWQGLRVQELCKWLVRDYPGARKFNPLQLLGPVREALQRLEHRELVTSSTYDRSSIWRITRLGETALAEGAVERYVKGYRADAS
jgi:hypothetical protein